MKPLAPIARIAFIAALIGPVQNIAGWAIAGALWPEYDAAALTISDLASPQSPVRGVMSAFFILGGTLILIAALYARTFAVPGRVVLFVAALCFYGLTVFPTPLHGSSDAHRAFAIGAFALSAGWPLFTMRLRGDAPVMLRPMVSVIATVVQAAIAVVFLIVWSDPNAVNVGVWERIVSFSQAGYLSAVIIVTYLGQRAVAR